MEDLVLQDYHDEAIELVRNCLKDSRILGFKYGSIKGCYYVDENQIVIFSIKNECLNNGNFNKFMDLLLSYNIDIIFKYVTNDRFRKHLNNHYHFKNDNNDVCLSNKK